MVEVTGVLFPGFVDCHTHAVFGAPRLDDHERRALGTDYKAIAGAGGGILESVRDVRARPEVELTELTRRRIRTLLSHGSTTIEVKSGYGLTLEAELKQLRVVRELAASEPVTLDATLLGAHEVPPEFRDRRVEFVRFLCDEMIPAVAANPECPVPSRIGNTTALEETKRSGELHVDVCEIVGERRDNRRFFDVGIEHLRVRVEAAEEITESAAR